MRIFLGTTVFWIIVLIGLWIYSKLFNPSVGLSIAHIFTTSTLPIQSVQDQFFRIEQKLDLLLHYQESADSVPSNTNMYEEKNFISILKSNKYTDVQLYYFNVKEDAKLPPEQQANIHSILPITRRIGPSENVLYDTIQLLIQANLTEEEKNRGFVNEFPLTKVRIIDAQVDENGEAILTFDTVGLQTTGGSARMLLLQKSIEKTALQFSFVRKVRIMPETLFQP